MVNIQYSPLHVDFLNYQPFAAYKGQLELQHICIRTSGETPVSPSYKPLYLMSTILTSQPSTEVRVIALASWDSKNIQHALSIANINPATIKLALPDQNTCNVVEGLMAQHKFDNIKNVEYHTPKSDSPSLSFPTGAEFANSQVWLIGKIEDLAILHSTLSDVAIFANTAEHPKLHAFFATLLDSAKVPIDIYPMIPATLYKQFDFCKPLTVNHCIALLQLISDEINKNPHYKLSQLLVDTLNIISLLKRNKKIDDALIQYQQAYINDTPSHLFDHFFDLKYLPLYAEATCYNDGVHQDIIINTTVAQNLIKQFIDECQGLTTPVISSI